jgi:hypothetical protein
MAQRSRRGLRRILVQIDSLRGHNLAGIIMAASGAYMMRTLQIAAV